MFETLERKLASVRWPEALPDHSGAAAVLVPLCRNPAAGGYEILLIKRSDALGYHKGQIAFPGGFREPSDRDLRQTAGREAEEEIGLAPADVRILGLLPLEKTIRDVLIFPVVGAFAMPYPFRLNRAEVDRILFLPVDHLVSVGVQPVPSPGPFRGESIGLTLNQELIWGATARILKSLWEVLVTP